MKKAIKTLAFAAAIMSLAVACGGNAEENANDTVIDSTPVETVVEDTVATDTVVAVEEEAAKPAAKPAAKKAPKETVADKVTVKGDGLTIKTNKGDEITVAKSGNVTAKTGTDKKVEINLAVPAKNTAKK